MRGVSLLLGTCGLVAGWLFWRSLAGQIPVPVDASSIAARLGLALLWLVPTAVLLWAMLLLQMGARFVYGVFDPLAASTPHLLAVNQRVISNTLEHGAVFGVAFLALASVAAGREMPHVLALAAVFAVGRAAFWAGYLVAPIGRAPGMAANLGATAGAVGGLVWIWLH